MSGQPTNADDVLDRQRRRVLVGAGTTLVAATTGAVGGVAAQQGDVTVALDNVGSTAWEVTSVSGAESVAPTSTDNPELTLTVGARYVFENGGWSFHPLAFRDADNHPLLTQDGTGRFEDDSDVNWVDDDTSVAFTLTSSLASELDDYICTVHSGMNGSIQTEQPQQPAASVTYAGGTIDGTDTTVDSVRLDDGGFVVIHDETLLDGDTLGSVVGASAYLDPGTSEDVAVDFDREVTENQTLIAMAHRDTNGDETYNFVASGGETDGPYTDTDGAITDSAEVVVEAAASVTFSGQTSSGTNVTVDSVRLDEGGFIVIHDETLRDGDTLGSVVGSSAYLDPGTSENVTVQLDDELSETQTLIAMAHQDTDGDETYDFVTADGDADGPYVSAGGAVTSSADVTVDPEGQETGTATRATAETGSDGAESDTSSGNGPGFGIAAGVGGFGGLAAYAYRKLGRESESLQPESGNPGE